LRQPFAWNKSAQQAVSALQVETPQALFFHLFGFYGS
jgi:hypothetical protein